MRKGLQQAARWWACLPLPVGPSATVLGYHRVEDDDDELCVRPGDFVRQVAVLAGSPLPVLDLESAWNSLVAGQAPRRAVILTFDDAWADNHTHALGPLADHALPATLFVPSKLLGKPGYLTVTQLREMADEGIVIGGHTRSHPDLRKCSDAELLAEVRGGREDLEELLGRPVGAFAYPTGYYDDRVRRAVVDAGYALAVSTKRGSATARSDAFAIPRHFVEGDFADRTFRATLHGGLDFMRLVERIRPVEHRE